MDRQLEKFKRQAHLLGRDLDPALQMIKEVGEERWRDLTGDFIRAARILQRAAMAAPAPWFELRGGLRPATIAGMAGEGNLYLETRKPYVQTGDYASVTLSTTSKNLLPQDGTGCMYPKNYWDLGKEWRFTMLGKFTTALTPGALTTELRMQAAQPLTDAGGSILSTSAAVNLTASKTGISFVIFGRMHSRSVIGATANIFAYAFFISDQLSLLLPAANIPQMIPAANAAAVAMDTTAAGGFSIQMKRSGSTAEAVVVQDLSVEAVT